METVTEQINEEDMLTSDKLESRAYESQNKAQLAAARCQSASVRSREAANRCREMENTAADAVLVDANLGNDEYMDKYICISRDEAKIAEYECKIAECECNITKNAMWIFRETMEYANKLKSVDLERIQTE